MLDLFETQKFTQGDSLSQTICLSDYPSPAWTLSFALVNAAGAINITTTPIDGTCHAVDVDPSTSSAWAPGRYTWTASVSDGTDRHTVGAGVVLILVDLSTQTAYDTRTHARRVLDAINALIESRASSGDIDTVKAAAGGRNIENDLEQLLKLRQLYQAQVDAEDRAAGNKPGFVQMVFR